MSLMCLKSKYTARGVKTYLCRKGKGPCFQQGAVGVTSIWMELTLGVAFPIYFCLITNKPFFRKTQLITSIKLPRWRAKTRLQSPKFSNKKTKVITRISYLSLSPKNLNLRYTDLKFTNSLT